MLLLRRIAACVFTFCAVLAFFDQGAASAQGITPPPVRSAVDQYGVDLLTGLLRVSTPSITIGQPGAGGLTYFRTYGSDQQAWRDNLAGGIHLSGSVYTVTLFGNSMRFSLSGGTFSSAENPGVTLVQTNSTTYTLTLQDGTIAAFSTSVAGTLPTQASVARVTQVTKPDNEVMTFTYTTLMNGSTPFAQRLQSLTNSLGYQIALEYQSNNANASGIRLVKATALNNTVDYCAPTANGCSFTRTWPSLSFSDNFAVHSVTDALNRTWNFANDGGSPFITSITKPQTVAQSGPPTLTLTYENGRVASVASSDGTWTYSYTDAGNQRTVLVNGPLTTQRRLISEISTSLVLSDATALLRTTSYSYYPTTNWLQRVTAPEGNYVEYTYDARGNVTETRHVAKAGSGLADILTSATYPTTCANAKTCNKPLTTTSPRGAVTEYTYDANHGGVLTITAPAPTSSAIRPQTRFTYASFFAFYKDAAGSIVQAPTSVVRPTSVAGCATTASCANGADEQRTNLTYGANNVANNRLVATIARGNGTGTLTATTAMTYTEAGDIATVNGPLSGAADTTTLRYDAMRQIVGVVSPDPDGAGTLRPRAIRTTYDADGQPINVEQGTVLSASDADWAAFAMLTRQATNYDTLGRPVRMDVIGATTTFNVAQVSYDAVGRLDCVAARMNAAAFSSLPNACTLSTAGSNGPDRIIRHGYDRDSQLLKMTSALGTPLAQETVNYTYTANGLQATLRDAGGGLTTFEYDGFDRPRRTRFPSASGGTSSTTDFEEMGYDSSSNIVSLRLRDGTTITSVYDLLERPTSTDAPGSTPDVTRAYDNFGRLTASSTPAHSLAMVYDQLNRLVSETSTFTGAAAQTVSYQYDLADRRTRLTWPDGYFVTYDTNLLDEVTAIRENGATSGVGVLATIAYNNVGARTTLTRGNGVVSTYGYDPLFRLTSLALNLAGTAQDQTLGFTYSAVDQTVARTSTNAAFDFTPTSATQFYSANQLNQYTSVGGGAVAHDARGNMTNDGSRTYGFDAFNRLSASDNGAAFAYDSLGRLSQSSATSAPTTRFVYDGADIIAELNTSGAIVRRYVHGPAMDEPLVWVEGASTADRRWLVADQLGSIVAVTNGAGTATTINSYDAFGRPGPSNAGRFQYTGQAFLPEAALYHYKARAYQPALGRFLQTDPILYAGGLNLYAYVANDPVNLTDPWGLQGCPHPDGGGCPNAIPPPVPSGEIVVPGARTSGNFASLRMRSGRPYVPLARAGTLIFFEDDEIVVTPGPADRRREKVHQIQFPQVWDFLVFLTPTAAEYTPTGRLFAVLNCFRCFEAGTLVQTPDGLRPIEALAVGDLVLSYNDATGAIEPKPITALIRPLPKAVMDVEIVDAGGAVERFGVTADHPWLIVRGEGALEWVKTLDLKPGDRLVTADGRGATFRSATLRDAFAQTYNLEVADTHTFLVGEDGVVVHNAGWCPGNFKTIRDSIEYHFGKHGANVGAVSPSQYVNMARSFARNLQGLSSTGLRSDGTIKYFNSQHFIIMRGSKIVSFGRK